jgi:hypothetical protein
LRSRAAVVVSGLLALLLPAATRAAWPVEYGNSGENIGKSVVTDSVGNVFAGGYTNAGIFGQTSLGNYDGYVAKFNQTGALQWSNLFGTSTSDYVYGVAAVGASSVVAVGNTGGALPTYSNAGGTDAMVRLYDSAGATVWTRQFGTAGDEVVQAVATDGLGHIYIGGYSTASFAGFTNAGSTDAFVAQLNAATGAVNWTFQIGSSVTDSAVGLAADSAGNVYLGGYTDGTLPGQTAAGNTDAFVLKVSVGGTLQWTKQFGTSGFDQVSGVGVDSTGAVLSAGYTNGIFSGQTSAGGYDAFAQKRDANGNVIWTNQFGTVGTEVANGLAINGADQAIVGGYTTGAFPGKTSAGGVDAFVRVLSSGGGVDFTDQFGGAGNDYANAVATDTLGHAYLAGYTDGALPGQTNAGGNDAFLIQTVPEPATGALVALGLLPLIRRRRRE